ncbi:MAG: hypothetical protein R3F60_10905 [bacterium]
MPRAADQKAAADDAATAACRGPHPARCRPRLFLVAFWTGRPGVVQAIVAAATRLDARRAPRSAGPLAALGSLGSAVGAVLLGAALAGPAFAARLAVCGATLPGGGLWAAVGSPVGVAGAAALLAVLALCRLLA